jgi:thiol-disulfide isomerase/thioredoxin
MNFWRLRFGKTNDGVEQSERSPVDVVVYSKDDCPLCDEAAEHLARLAKRHRLRIRTVDVTADRALFERFHNDVPAVEIDGVVRFRGRINDVLFERLIANRASLDERSAEQ